MVLNARPVKSAISAAMDWVTAGGLRMPLALADRAVVLGIKTMDYYLRVLYQWVNDLYTGQVSQDEFIDKLAEVIEQQLTRAWNEGMRANGLTIEDMIPEWQNALTEIIANQYTYVDNFASDIASGRYTLAQLQSRAGIWANQYNSTVNEAIRITADGKDRLIWVYSPEKVHCPECEGLNGIVAFAREWDELGVHPQGFPNPMISCTGANCGCSLVPTQQRRSPKAFETIMNIVTRG